MVSLCTLATGGTTVVCINMRSIVPYVTRNGSRDGEVTPSLAAEPQPPWLDPRVYDTPHLSGGDGIEPDGNSTGRYTRALSLQWALHNNKKLASFLNLLNLNHIRDGCSIRRLGASTPRKVELQHNRLQHRWTKTS